MDPRAVDTLKSAEKLTWSWLDLVLILLGSGAIFALGLLVFLLATGAGGFAPGELPQELSEPSIEQSLGLAALEALALAGGVYLLGLKRKGLGWRDIGLREISWRWVLIVTGITLVAIPASTLLTLLVLLVLNQPFENPQLDFLIPEGFSWLSAIGMLLLGGIAAPFGEELLFRGVLFRMVRARWGLWAGVLVSSLIFAALHGHIAVAVSAFVLGLLLALVYHYSGSLWAAVIVHALNNSARIVLLYILVALGLAEGL
jgi:membrane protease YdiL (CAAX protease family)